MITPSFSPTATERVLPKLALDFTTASLDSRVTFTRTTDATHPATYIASNGYITSATNNQPRFDYDPLTSVCKGLLIEESRTNMIVQSSDYTVSPWTYTNSSIVQNATTAPDGTNTAQLHIPNNGSNVGGCTIYQTVAVTTGTAYSVTFYAKPNASITRISLFCSVITGGGNWANFDLVGAGSVSKQGTAWTPSISLTKDNWYKCTATATSVSTASNIIAFYTGGVTTVVGDGTSGIYIWGAQLEAGAFPTSYIPTTTTALTRNADVATMTGSNFSSWYNASEGSFVVQTASNLGYPNLAFTLNNAGSDFIQTRNDGSVGKARLLVYNSATLVINTSSNATTYNPMKQAYGLKSGSTSGAVNGTLFITNNAASLPTGINSLSIGCGNNYYANGWVQKLNYYPQRLTNAELQAFSK